MTRIIANKYKDLEMAGRPYFSRSYFLSVIIDKKAVDYICNQADKGYETPYKQERLGFLFGTASKENISIKIAYFYKGGYRTRTKSSWIESLQRKRKSELEQKFCLPYLGMYHTHVETGNKLQWGLSPDDRSGFLTDKFAIVELVVCVWARSSIPFRITQKRLKNRLKVYKSNYCYIFSAYTKNDNKTPLTLLECPQGV